MSAGRASREDTPRRLGARLVFWLGRAVQHAKGREEAVEVVVFGHKKGVVLPMRDPRLNKGQSIARRRTDSERTRKCFAH